MDGSFLDVAREVLDRPIFTPNRDRVTWNTIHGPYDLPHAAVHAMLDIFEGSDSPAAPRLFNDLYTAASRTEGFIPRVTSHCVQGLGSSQSQPCGARGQEPRRPQSQHFDGRATR